MYLYGPSGHAKVIIDILKSQGIRIDGLIDENVKELLGYPLSHGRHDLSTLIISIGNNFIRKKIILQLNAVYGKGIHSSG